MKKILGMGNALVDIMIPIEGDNILELLALPKGSMQLVDIDRVRRHGKVRAEGRTYDARPAAQ